MVRVVVVSDIRLYREGLAEMLARDGRLQVVGTAPTIELALSRIASTAAEAALIDMGMPEGVGGVRAVAESGQAVKIVALGISETRRDVLSCAEAGVQGYVCRDSSIEDLVDAVRSAVEGELHCPPRIAAALMNGVARLAAQAAARERVLLTGRELEVATLIDAGLANREIAARLNIALPTVKVHVHNILDKLGVEHRGAAAAKLRNKGLLRPTRPVAGNRPTPVV